MTKRSTSVSTDRFSDDDWILHVIVILAISIELIFDALKCLISLTCKPSIQRPGNSDSLSTSTTCTRSGSTKSQPPLPSTKPISVTEDRKRAAGGSPEVGPSKPSASSPRSRRSKPTSSTQKSTKSGTSRTSVSRQRSRTTTSSSPTDMQPPILSPVLCIADDNHTSTDDQPT